MTSRIRAQRVSRTVWTPQYLRGISLRLEAFDSSTITSTVNGLSRINDKSGFENDAIQDTFEKRPIYDDVNGAMIFDGTASYMEGAAGGNSNFLFFVFETTGGYTAADSPDCIFSINEVIRSILFGAATSAYNDEVITFSSGAYRSSSSIEIPAGVNTLAIRKGALNHEIYLNGGNNIQNLSNGSQTAWALNSDYVLGSSTSSGANFFNGKIYAILSGGEAISLDELRRVEGYYATQVSGITLPNDHPYKGTEPTL